jgi:hypothetical protein
VVEKASDNQKNQTALLKALEAIGAASVNDDSIRFAGTEILLPETFKGPGGIREAVKFLVNYEKQQEQKFDMSVTFPFRPWDGAHAFQAAMRKVFGSAGLGQSIQTMFGEIKPQLVSIETDLGKKTQVPWGNIRLDQIEATFSLGGTRDKELGLIFFLSAEAPRKYKGHVEAFFKMVEAELREHSIYRGKAIDGAEQPHFIDVFKVDRSKVYYGEETMRQLDANFFSLLTHSDTMRKMKLPLKRAVLLEGPYGTGKTLAGMLAAQDAVKNGWTFILCRPGTDNLTEVLQTAQLYAPSVVWYEDIDVIAGAQGDDMSVSKVLDMLDSVTNKGVEVIAGFTTNHVDKIQKGVLRPGRLDAVIHIGDLDRVGFEKLVRATLNGQLDPKTDFDKVATAYEGFLPAFAVEATRRALRYAISRTDGNPGLISTSDLVSAAEGLRPQLELMSEATEGATKNELDTAFAKVVGQGISGTRVVDSEDYSPYSLVPAMDQN